MNNPIVVAEISCNHGQNPEYARRLIEMAKTADADMVKIQCYVADEMTNDKENYLIKGGTPWDGRHLHTLYERGQTDEEMVTNMFTHAKRVGIPIFSSVFSIRGLALLEALECPIYKIASFENNDYDLIRQVSTSGKPIVVSTGMASDKDLLKIKDAVSNIAKLSYMHCISAYPTYTHEANINRMDRIRYVTGIQEVGFSDHTVNDLAALAATVKGAHMIEKHLTIDQNTLDGSFSLNPDQFLDYVRNIREIKGTLVSKFDPQQPYTQFKRSVYAIKNIAPGEKFTRLNTRAMRPYKGCDPEMLDFILTKVALVDIPEGTPISLKDVSK